jgi:hypothetical protein
LQLPANQVIDATGPDDAEATFDVTAAVACTATDNQQVAAVNVAAATFTVTVNPQQFDTTTTDPATTTNPAAVRRRRA